MNIYISSKKEVNNINSVETKELFNSIDLSKNSVALHIGKQDQHHDFLISFPNCNTLIQGESKFSESGSTTIFNGTTKSSFKYEQNQANKSNCKLKNNFFLFITNAHMDETNKENIVNKNSMFINKERWVDAFSSIFEFLKDLSKYD